jgi:Na+-driven multidrug efflux pump
MNKYVLILPLVVLSVFFGYFGSTLQVEHVYAIAVVTTVFVATYQLLLFLKHQKRGEDKLKRKRF